MALEVKYDKVSSVEIGFDDTAGANFVEITNVLYFAYRVVSVEGDMVTALSMINDYVPGGVHHSHKYLEMELCLDTDWLTDSTDRTTRWAYTQDVDAAAGVHPAIDEDGANPDIEYFLVNVREYDGAATTLCFTYDAPNNYGATNVLWCTGETSEISNEDGTPHQTVTFRFICLQDVVRA
uniref:Uncharacterized protein n=1 Tax=viral metagenome TaxID=1070528 RepID=A0A6M3MC77_9ZZZZ